MGYSVLIAGQVVAERAIVRLELWDGGSLVSGVDLEEPATEHSTGWEWVPETVGVHALLLRAFDDQGRAATSFPLWVRAIDPAPGWEAPPQASLLPRVAPVVAPTARVSVDEATCLARVDFPALDAMKGQAVYAANMASVGFVPVDLLPAEGGSSNIPISASPLIVYAEAFDSSLARPLEPMLIMPPPVCATRHWIGELQFGNGVLSNRWDATQVYAYVSYDDMASWGRVPAKDQTFVDTTDAGDFDFGPALAPALPGTTVHLDVWGWINGVLRPLGTGRFEAPTAARPPPGLPQPIGGLTTVSPSNGPVFIPSSLDWVRGWTGLDSEIQQPLYARSATICTFAPTGQTTSTVTIPVSVVGGETLPPGSTQPTQVIAVYPDYCTNYLLNQPVSQTFHWRPQGQPSHGLIQVSVQPPPSGSAVTFPGLTYTQKVGAGQPGQVVEFDLDLNLLKQQQINLDIWPFGSFEELFSGQGQIDPDPVPDFPTLGMVDNRRLYVRVLPMAGDNILAGESNRVEFEYIDDAPPPPAPDAPAPPTISVAMRLTPPGIPNPAFGGCVRVVSNPFGSKNPDPYGGAIEGFYKGFEDAAFVYFAGQKIHVGMIPGSTVCGFIPKPKSKSWYDHLADAVNFVGWVWDMYVGVWEMIKDTVADALAHLSGCVTLAKAAGKSAADAEKICKSVANTAITVVLTAYGVPPTFPKFQDLVELGKGDLKEWLIQQAVDAGLDCGALAEQCQDFMDELLDGLFAEIQKQASQATVAAIQADGYALFINPEIVVIPEPAGIWSPAVFEVTITRTFAQGPVPASCTYSGLVLGKKDYYEWYDHHNKVSRKEPVSAVLKQPGKMVIDLEGIKPLEKRSGVLILDKGVEWYLPGQHPALSNVPWNIKPADWIFYRANPPAMGPGTTTIEMHINGCGIASSSFPQASTYPTPKDIPYP